MSDTPLDHGKPGKNNNTSVTCFSCGTLTPDSIVRSLQVKEVMYGPFCPSCLVRVKNAMRSAFDQAPYKAPPNCDTLIQMAVLERNDKAREAREQSREHLMQATSEHLARDNERRKRIKDARPALEENYALVTHQEAEKVAQQDAIRAEQKKKAQDQQKLAQKVLAQRALASRHLLPYVRRMLPAYEAGWVHRDICRRLERFSEQVARGESPRLMLTMPPRHGKSELASKNFPGWHLGRYPTHDVITASYSASLATDFSKKVRAAVRGSEFREIFPGVGIDPDNQNAEGWSTNKGGMYVPAGVEGPITGRGAHILIIDDPVKNREEAESATRRQAVKDWYTSTAYTRLAPGGGILIIQTRWHEDDLSGWLLAEAKEGGEEWEVIDYPAVAVKDEEHRKVGEALHPKRYPLEALMRIKKAIGRRDWQALYQQDPIGEEGDFFQGKDLRYYTPSQRPPLDELTIYSAWDLAIGEQSHNDFTVGIVFGIDRAKNMWLLDNYRGQWGSREIVDKLFEMYNKWKPQVTGIERMHVEQAIGPFIEEQKRAREMYEFRIEPLKHGNRDKLARASAIRGLVEMHRVYLPKNEPWCDEFVSELLKFPNGKLKDQVDAFSWAGQMVKMFLTVPMPKPKKKKSWRDKLDKYVQQGVTATSHMAS